MQLQDVHVRSLTKSATLSGYYYPMARASSPREVIAVLNAASVSFVLVGAHGLGGWTRKPRATEDVDVVVATKHHPKAVKSLLGAFSHLEAVDLEVVTRLRDRQTQEVAIDVMKPNQLYRATFKNTKSVSVEGQTYRIPSLEMALAMKFAAMISLTRADNDKLQDLVDFKRVIEANDVSDGHKLSELGDLVYSGGGKELVEMVRKVRAGEKLIL